MFAMAEEVADFIIEKSNKATKKRRDEEMEIITDYMVLEIEEGQIYSDKNILKTTIGFYAMIKNFQIKTKRSKPREYMVTCIDENCSWFLRASKLKQTQTFKVRNYVNNHTCSLDVIMKDHRQVSYNTIGQIVKNKYDSINKKHAPNDIMKDLLHEFGVSMGYQKA
uniref:Transposase MuDR plant domain-containing protein n=1 Tax=Cannabis sativa TaxID=3483 RepID=A0A803PZP3_CANSA